MIFIGIQVIIDWLIGETAGDGVVAGCLHCECVLNEERSERVEIYRKIIQTALRPECAA